MGDIHFTFVRAGKQVSALCFMATIISFQLVYALRGHKPSHQHHNHHRPDYTYNVCRGWWLVGYHLSPYADNKSRGWRAMSRKVMKPKLDSMNIISNAKTHHSIRKEIPMRQIRESCSASHLYYHCKSISPWQL